MHRETHFERIIRAEKETEEGRLSLYLREPLLHLLKADPADFHEAWEQITPAVICHTDTMTKMGVDSMIAVRSAKTFGRTWLYQQAILRHGSQVYVPTLDLSKRLLNTHIDNLKCSDVHLPFRAIYIQAPEGLGFQIYDDMTGYHDFEGVYLVEETEPRAWRVLVVGAGKNGDLDDTTMDARIDLSSSDKSFRDVLEEIRQGVQNPQGRAYLHKAWTDVLESSKWIEIVEWVARVVLYATCANARHELRPDVNPKRRHFHALIQGASKKRQRKKLAERRDKLPPWRRILLGNGEASDSSGSGLPLLTGHWVQGHFQHYHTKKAGRILKWKEPYWQGPGDAAEHPEPADRILT